MSDYLVVRLPEQDKITLQNLAEKKQVSVSFLVRKAIKDCVTGVKKENLLVTLGALAKKKAAGKTSKDLSQNYKKYLYRR